MQKDITLRLPPQKAFDSRALEKALGLSKGDDYVILRRSVDARRRDIMVDLVCRINPRLVLLGVILIAIRIALGVWFREISSTALFYTFFLLCTHIHVLNQPFNEEAL